MRTYCFVLIIVFTVINIHQCETLIDGDFLQNSVLKLDRDPQNRQQRSANAYGGHTTRRWTTRRTTTRSYWDYPSTRQTTTSRWNDWTWTTRRTTEYIWDSWPSSTRTTRDFWDDWTTTTTSSWLIPEWSSWQWTSLTESLTSSTRPPTTTRPRTTTRKRITTTRPKTTTRPRTTAFPPYDKPYTEGNFQLPPRPGEDNRHSTEINIVNKYEIHAPGIYSLPIQNDRYPDYYESYTYHHYTPSDTGNDILGFYLGYKLEKLSTPTYAHRSFYDGYRPIYDHYTVHHYHNQKENISKEQEISSNNIMGCVGDSSEVCPTNTTSLCTSDGNLICVAPTTSTVPCINHQAIHSCVTSAISCNNNSAAECADRNKESVLINIPCVATLKIDGKVKVINGTIVADLPKRVNDSSTVSSIKNVISSQTNNTSSIYTSNVNGNWSTRYPITTTPLPVNVTIAMSTVDISAVNTSTTPTVAVKEDNTKEYCAILVAIPAKKPLTLGENFLSDTASILDKFIDKVWGL